MPIYVFYFSGVTPSLCGLMMQLPHKTVLLPSQNEGLNSNFIRNEMVSLTLFFFFFFGGGGGGWGWGWRALENSLKNYFLIFRTK